MQNAYTRTELLLGTEAMQKLRAARVAVFGVGGVGSYAVEALARSGVGTLDLIDNDRFTLTNLNRQLYATRRTLGQYKTDAAAERIAEIDPTIQVNVYRTFYMPETAGQFDFREFDYVIDAIDTVTGKLALVCQAQEAGTPIISSMGAGNKLDPTAFEVADISETSVCPLAKVMRRELKKRGVKKLKVVYSKEPPLTPQPISDDAVSAADPESAPPLSEAAPEQTKRRQTPGSVSFVPSVAGLILAGEVIKDLVK
ncbi:MAG: tRNA threonylcarbamoyladenosine dehydratase [Lachnospiraceae bacterium]|nr:tRNA threonylcarbamoyladenosine dehydratase [Lachnospiraceae bacterium]